MMSCDPLFTIIVCWWSSLWDDYMFCCHS